MTTRNDVTQYVSSTRSSLRRGHVFTLWSYGLESPNTETPTCGGRYKDTGEVWFLEQVSEEIFRAKMENGELFVYYGL